MQFKDAHSHGLQADRAFYCERKTFPDYMKILSQAAGQEIVDFSSMMGALEQRLAFFAEFGTTVSEQRHCHITWEEYTGAQAEDNFPKGCGWGAVIRGGNKQV